MRVYLIRHGRTAWNKGLVFRGRADVPLDDMGRDQAECAARALRDAELAAIYASPLSRAQETAAAIARLQGVPVQTDPAFNDLDYGEFQGMAADAARAAFPEVYRTWESAPHRVTFPGGGSLDDVARSAMPRLAQLADVHSGRDIAVVTHRVVLKVILCQVLWRDNARFWDVQLDTASISMLERGDDGLRVVSQNDTKHLADLNQGVGQVDF